MGPLTRTALKGEACAKLPASCAELPACTVFLPCELVLEEFLNPILTNRTEAFPVQLSCRTVSSAASTSTNQSSCSLTIEYSIF